METGVAAPSGHTDAVAYRTLGCKANQYDTERMRQELEARGTLTVPEWSDADVCVVNTCTVTNRADADARRLVRRIKRENPSIRVVVAGCSAALRGAAYRGMNEVDAVVEGHDAAEVARAAADSSLVQLGVGRSLDQLDIEPVAGAILVRREGATRGWLKIQDGCDRRCAFCATRLARGESRSRDPDEVVAEARVLSRSHPELVLTGIHIGHYGRDLEPRETLSSLVARVVDEVPDVRLRLGSVEATELDDRLLDLLEGAGGRIAPHVHMPLQSGADPVLRRMRRWHSREDYRRRALEIAERVPTLGMGADVITGFPGETEGDHAHTRSLIEELPFTYLHVFPFSPRDDTVAADLDRPVPQRVARERSLELRELAQEKGRRYRARRLGSSANVVFEGATGRALTGDYLRVVVADPPAGVSRIHRVTLTGTPDDLRIDLPHAAVGA